MGRCRRLARPRQRSLLASGSSPHALARSPQVQPSDARAGSAVVLDRHWSFPGSWPHSDRQSGNGKGGNETADAHRIEGASVRRCASPLSVPPPPPTPRAPLRRPAHFSGAGESPRFFFQQNPRSFVPITESRDPSAPPHATYAKGEPCSPVFAPTRSTNPTVPSSIPHLPSLAKNPTNPDKTRHPLPAAYRLRLTPMLQKAIKCYIATPHRAPPQSQFPNQKSKIEIQKSPLPFPSRPTSRDPSALSASPR